MSYLVLARKWRPKLFSEVVGQDHAVQALKNSIVDEKVNHKVVSLKEVLEKHNPDLATGLKFSTQRVVVILGLNTAKRPHTPGLKTLTFY